MERILNIFHYCIYLFFNKLHLFSNKLNPFLLLFKISYFTRKARKQGVDPYEEQNKVWMNKKSGFNIWIAEVILGSTIMIILLSLFFIITRAFSVVVKPIPFVLFFVAIGTYITYVYVSKNDKYLIYYEEFEHWTKKEKRKYMLFSFLAIIATIALFFASFMVSF